MRIVFFGTSEFAVPALKKLHESGDYEIAGVVTQPDKPAGRKQEPLPSPVKSWALEQGLKIFQPPHLFPPPPTGQAGTGGEELPFVFPPLDGEGKGGVDLFIVSSYGKIIPKEILDMPKYGTINIHPSLLPKYRGPSPIQAAILNGDKETGVTIMKMDEQLDHGPVLEYGILNMEYGIYYKELHDSLAELGAELLMEALPKYIKGEIKPIPQDDSKATYTKLITKDDARIDWSKSAEEIDRLVRAYHVWPVAWTTFFLSPPSPGEGRDKGRGLIPKRLKIFNSHVLPPLERGGIPPLSVRGGEGELLVQNNKLLVHCGRGILEIKNLQMEGGKKLTAAQFISGYKGLFGAALH